jgi:hypothetical protein
MGRVSQLLQQGFPGANKSFPDIFLLVFHYIFSVDLFAITKLVIYQRCTGMASLLLTYVSYGLDTDKQKLSIGYTT